MTDTVALIEDNVSITIYPSSKEKTMTQKYDERHGGPYDRGSADRYYRRGYCPHYFVGESYSSLMVAKNRMTAEELDAYRAGYEYNESLGDYKDYR